MPLTGAQEAAAVILLAAGAGEIALAGGSGLIVHGVIDRDTKDLDAFTRDFRTDTHELAARVRGAFERAGYTVVDRSATPDVTLRRLMVTPGTAERPGRRGRPVETIQIEIGQDFQALPAIATKVGPVLDPVELGANKILTVYNDVRARDADDLARLAARYSFDRMLTVADRKEREPLDRRVLADQMSMFARLGDAQFPWLSPDLAHAVKRFMVDAGQSLRAGHPVRADLSPYTRPTLPS